LVETHRSADRLEGSREMSLRQWTGRAARRAALVLAGTFLGAGVASASPITYDINQAIGGGSVTGTIQTDGATGTLGTTDFLAWSLDLNGVGATYHITDANSSVRVVGSDVTTTARNLFFNFSGSDDGYLLFQQALFSGMHYYCDATSKATCFQGASVTPQAYTDPSFQNVALGGNQIIATAVPEPATLALFSVALAPLGFALRRKSG
jgi:hypothetical protein